VNNETTVFDILKTPAELVKFLPIRVVLRQGEDGTLQGIVEHSFSMAPSPTDVRIWWSGTAYSMLGEHQLNGIEDATYNTKEGDLLVDPLSDDSPIEIDWKTWLAASSKFSQRNAPFKLKGITK
jgi:hypothetical protein